MDAMKPINASRMAMRGDGKHTVAQHKVIETMCDMQGNRKETSRDGLAVSVIEC